VWQREVTPLDVPPPPKVMVMRDSDTSTHPKVDQQIPWDSESEGVDGG
jgi:hypothetical protein